MGWIHVCPGGEDYLAFLPDPLPPRIEMSRGLMESLLDAELAMGSLGKLIRDVGEIGVFSDPFVYREAVCSSRIEHIHASLLDLYLYRATSSHGAAEVPTNIRRVMGCANALRYGIDRLNTLPVGLRFMRELHQRLMCNAEDTYAYPGEFRRTQNWIGPPGSTPRNAFFVPPPAEQMYGALYDLEAYINRDDDKHPPLVRLAIVHYQFEAIHPFVDGNGRVGRMLIPILLAYWGLLPVPVLCMSAYFYRLQTRYHKLLLNVSLQGKWREWIAFFLRGVSEQATHAVMCVKELLGLRQKWLNTLGIGEQDKERAVVDFLFVEPVTTVERIRQGVSVPPGVAEAVIGELKKAGILHTLPANRGVCSVTEVLQMTACELLPRPRQRSAHHEKESHVF